LANASAGIEPIFSYSYERHVLEGKVLLEIHPQLQNVFNDAGVDHSTALKQAAREGTLRNVKGLPDKVKEVFVTTGDLTPEQHVEMQARFQKHSDSGVSKTINLRAQATVDDVKRAFVLAHELKCKGITIYRDGTRPGQVLQLEACPDCARA
jgi:ribonucleoside-diphosphate reductase alpha chain